MDDAKMDFGSDFLHTETLHFCGHGDCAVGIKPDFFSVVVDVDFWVMINREDVFNGFISDLEAVFSKWSDDNVLFAMTNTEARENEVLK